MDPLGPDGAVAELLADLLDVAAERAQAGLAQAAQRLVDDALLREVDARVRRQVAQDLELGPRELDLALPDRDPPRLRVYHEVAGDDARPDDPAVGVRVLAAQDGPHPRDELAGGERLGHVVVHAVVEPGDDLVDSGLPGDDDDGRAGLLLGELADPLARQLRKHEVDHGEVVGVEPQHRGGHLAVPGDVHVVAEPHEVGPHALPDHPIVLDDQDAVARRARGRRRHRPSPQYGEV